MLKQAENKVAIEGILSEVDIKEGDSQNTGKHYVMGEIKVRVNQEVNGESKQMEVPVSLFATQVTNKGTPNPAYTNIMKIKDEYTSIASCGDVDKASRIRITRGELAENSFYGNDGTLVAQTRIRTSFNNRISAEECNDKAEFTAVIVIANIKDEIKNDEPTGRLAIKGILPQYGGRVDVIDFVVASTEAINHIQTYWNEGDTVRVHGKVNFSSKTIHTETEVGFGEPIKEDRTVSVRELVITSGSPSALDGDMAYDESEVKTALKERQAYLEQQKEKSKGGVAKDTKKGKTSADFGF